MICDYCGKEISPKLKRGRKNRFCSFPCREKYHNALKKVPHSLERAAFEIAFLIDSTVTSGELADQALSALQKITQLSLELKPKFECSNCGQTLFFKPELGARCHFCGESNWKVTVLGRKP